MKRWLLILVLLFWGSAAAEAVDAYRVVSSSSAIEGSSAKVITCKAYFPADVESTWKVLNDFSHFPLFIPRVLATDPLGTTKEKERVYVLMDTPWPLQGVWNILGVTRDLPSHQMNWTMEDGNIAKHSGMLRLEKEGSGTKLDMKLTVDLGLGLPGWVIAWGAKYFLPKVMVSIGNRLGQQRKAKSK